MVTTDWNMEFTHTDEIKASEVAILATANNNHPVSVWVSAIVKARAAVERTFKKQQRPYFSRISKEGHITQTRTVTPNRTSKRYRPKEKCLKEIAPKNHPPVPV